MLKTSSTALQALVLAALISSPAIAKTTKSEAPPPPAVPVPKVDAEPLNPPGPDKLEGTALVVDGDEIRIGDSVLRLYGIAAPDLSAHLGPEARVALDGLLNGRRVNCLVFDKTPQGDAVGQCLAGGSDPAETLLSKGLAAVYRNGNNNDGTQATLTGKYDAAETLARKQQLGLWQPPVPQGDPQAAAAAAERSKARVLGYAGFALLILAIFTVSITRVSIARRDRAERERQRRGQRTTLSYAMAAEVEIVLAATRRLMEQIANLPADRPVPGAIGAALALPSTTFWNANGERLYLLPVEVTIPLLRFHALHEDAVRKLAVASAIPSGVLAAVLRGLVETGAATVNAIEGSLGIAKTPPPEPKATPIAAPPPPAPATPAASSELKTPPRAATN